MVAAVLFAVLIFVKQKNTMRKSLLLALGFVFAAFTISAQEISAEQSAKTLLIWLQINLKVAEHHPKARRKQLLTSQVNSRNAV